MRRDTELPGTWRSLLRAYQIAYHAEPKLLVVSFVLITGALIPDALIALWLKFLAQGVIEQRSGLLAVATAGLAASAAASWLMRIVGDRVHFLFRERATIAIESYIAKLQGTVATIAHHERPEYLDRLQLLRDQAFLLNHLYHSSFGMLGMLVRLAITVVLLFTVHPALLALAVFALPTVLTSSWRAGVERVIEERAAPNKRLARHFLDLGTLAGPGKEVRVSGTGHLLVARRRGAWERYFRRISAARWNSAFWLAAAWALFGAAYVGALVYAARVQRASPGDVVLVLTAGANLSRYLGMAAGQTSFLRWCIDAASRLVWLERYAAENRDAADAAAPASLTQGIVLEQVSFRYPGTDAWVLRDVSLHLPAGAVVAVVGENGAGKTTLVKLLCRFYEPTEGRITVDGADLSRIPAAEWRDRLGGAFQDFFRFEYLARTTVGLGDLDRMELEPALRTAVTRGGATDVIDRLPSGFDTQLGPVWENGVELSFGQWQKLALSRGFMRDNPLLLVLDEPTAALDAETEHDLFERFAAQSRAATSDGRITILVSHRFSTVRMADLIVVLDGHRVAEVGSHDELMAKNGLYADLYGIQARAYR